jgi:histone deacetylase 1/2
MDNGREFDNHSLHDFSATHGILLRFSCPYMSPQNGKAEHIIRTINDIVRTLLFQASMPPKFCVESLHTATHLLNRLPTKAISAPSSFFTLFSTPPTYSDLRTFGCLCYPNIAATMSHKLSHRSVSCVFLRYASNHRGYRCMDIESHHIIISQHVIFDETRFPFAPDYLHCNSSTPHLLRMST